MEDLKLWKENGLPRKGWVVTCVTELENGELSACDWCGTEIKFVYTLCHDEVDDETESGCICAEHLTEDYIRPKELKRQYFADKAAERKELRAHAKSQRDFVKAEARKQASRDKWRDHGWRQSQNGNTYKKLSNGHIVTVFKSQVPGYAPKQGPYGWVTNGTFSTRRFESGAAAKEDFIQVYLLL